MRRSSAAQATWRPSLDILALAIDPASGTVYAGSLGDGVFSSADGGTSWTPQNAGLFNLTVNALALDAERLYAGSGGDGAFVMPLGAAAGQAVLGKTLVIKNPSADAAKRTLVVVASEIGSADTLDPAAVAASGATLTIAAAGGTPSSQTFALPAPWILTGSTGAKYVDKLGANGPVKLALLKKTAAGKFTLKVKIAGKLGPGPQPRLTVVPPDPGTGASALLQVIGGDAYCVAFGGSAGGTLTNTPTTFKVTGPTAQTCAP